jgi:hypothetical protein
MTQETTIVIRKNLISYKWEATVGPVPKDVVYSSARPIITVCQDLNEFFALFEKNWAKIEKDGATDDLLSQHNSGKIYTYKDIVVIMAGDGIEGTTTGNSNEDQKPFWSQKAIWKHKAIPFGESDVAALTLTGCHNGQITASILRMGEDGCYTAYVFEAEEEAPVGLELAHTFNDWAKVYDDQGLAVKISGPVDVYANNSGGIVLAKKDAETRIKVIPR